MAVVRAHDRPRFLVAGEGGLSVELSAEVDEAVNAAVHRLDAEVRWALRAEYRAGILVAGVPSYRSLLLIFDPLRLERGRLESILWDILSRMGWAAGADYAKMADHAEVAGAARTAGVAPRRLEIPVCYQDELAPDLPEVASLTGMSPEEVVRLHTGQDFLVHMIGFQLGYPYMASLPVPLRLPRLARPRLSTPPGAVAIAGELTGVYSLESPGGWRVIGRTPARLWDLGWDPPTLFRAGDRVRFRAVSRDVFDRLAAGRWLPEGAVSLASPAAEAASASGRPAAASPAVEVVRPGFLSLVQDLGRRDCERYGVGPGGAMDPFALRVGNRLLGNAEGAAALEITGGEAEFRFLRPTVFAWTGGTGRLELGGAEVPAWTALEAAAGQRLKVGLLEQGFRGYLCLAAGVDVPSVLGSRGTYLAAGFGGLDGRPLRAGDVLHTGEQRGQAARRGQVGRAAAPEVLRAVYWPPGGIRRRLRLVPGPQCEAFTAGGLTALYGGSFRLSSDSNRMGYRLVGPTVEPQGTSDILSDGLVTGAVQVPSNGQPVLLMADHQTTGGYAKAGVLVRADLPLAAQLRPGDDLGFEQVSPAKAVELLAWLERQVALAAGDLLTMLLVVDGKEHVITVDRGLRQEP